MPGSQSCKMKFTERSPVNICKKDFLFRELVCGKYGFACRIHGLFAEKMICLQNTRFVCGIPPIVCNAIKTKHQLEKKERTLQAFHARSVLSLKPLLLSKQKSPTNKNCLTHVFPQPQSFISTKNRNVSLYAF